MSNASSLEAERQLLAARRAGARLAAVQALYQMEQTEQSARSVIADFMADRLGLNDEGEPVEEADPDIFRAIVDGTVERQEAIDGAIMKRLANGWKIERLDATSRAILRAAVYELIAEVGLPSQIILDEYVSIAHAFFEGAEPRFINGLLDAVSRDIRSAS
ncbi:MAG: transcription antitermination factor NusB [Alphaproteobacteria bacterium]|nr:MAG: transcription antitermination factor NusB [Alphaproteobacteria bacterium]RYY96523.1 MAG: transcription antitermination factor NusB [Alphaproteobacteria bacterium]